MNPTTRIECIDLTQTFHYENATHRYDLKWCTLGDPKNPPVIFVHGTPWSSRVWTPFAMSLSRIFHIYLFDNPGFGESPLERELTGTQFDSPSKMVRLDADLARQSEVYAALFKHWEQDWSNQLPHVIAHDHGGLMALRGYLLHNCHYASLCLIDVVAIGPFGQALFKAVAENPSHFAQLPTIAFDGILESYIRNAAFHELPRSIMQMLKAPWLRDGGKEGFIRQLCQANSRSTEELEARYPEVGQNIPVKIIWGIEDNWLPMEVASRLGKALRAKEIVHIEHAGHLVMYDEPAQLGVEIGDWLRTVSS